MPRPARMAAAAIAAVAIAAIAVFFWKGSPPETRDSDRVTLYEGLPHQMYEPERLEQERTAKPTIETQGFPFYRAPLPLTAGDADALKAIFGDARTFRPFGGEKKCGGFHPDYAVKLTSGAKATTYLICFGCGEVKVSGPGQPGTRYDLDRAATTRLKGILQPYRKNRPIPKAGSSLRSHAERRNEYALASSRSGAIPQLVPRRPESTVDLRADDRIVVAARARPYNHPVTGR